MTGTIDSVTKKRLVYVKKLYLHGREHVPKQTEFDRMIALHHFDNAIELLLKCVATKLNIAFKTRFVNFPDLWDNVNQKVQLSKKTEIFQLHDLRSDVQHWGVAPFSSEVVDRFDVYVLDFIKEVLTKVFGLNFEELFMSSLVEDALLRKLLSIAESALEQKDYVKCMRYADAAWHIALRRREEGFRFLSDQSAESEFVTELADIVSIIALGIDYVKYQRRQRFNTHAIWNKKEEALMYSEPFFEPDAKVYSSENASFSFNFTLDCVLQWHF